MLAAERRTERPEHRHLQSREQPELRPQLNLSDRHLLVTMARGARCSLIEDEGGERRLMPAVHTELA